MQRLILFFGLIIFATGITYALKVSAQERQAKKLYHVSQSIEWWSHSLNVIEAAKTQLKQSDLPSNKVVYLCDSLLAPIQYEMTRQIQDQLNAEQKKDSIKTKK